MKKWGSMLLVLAMLLVPALPAFAADVPAPLTAAAGALPFADVEPGAWYADAVGFVHARGLMIGTGETTFSPEGLLTRAQLVTILWRLAGKPSADHVLPADVPAEAWYAEAARWAASRSPVDTGAFAPDEVLSREETARLLWYEARYLGADVSVGEDTDILRYDDAADVDAEYMPAMQWAVGAGVLEGSAGRLDPRGRLTRVEAAAMLRRFDAALSAQPEDTLSTIRARGTLRVGTTGDYRPLSFRDPETGEYWGFDVELVEDLAAALGVEIEYEPTTWPTLMEDTLAGKFDLAICGITVTEARREQALMSDGYLGNGKTVLCRAEDADKYVSLEAINRPEVTVMENPGGLNEKFARENLPDATLVIHDVNEEIPGLVAAGEADVMITEILEGGWYVGQDSRLAAPLIYEPFTRGQLGVLMPKGSETLLDYVNAFLASEKACGRIDALAEKYVYQYIESAAGAAA